MSFVAPVVCESLKGGSDTINRPPIRRSGAAHSAVTGGRAEASRDDGCEAAPVLLLSSELFGSNIDDFHSRRQLELLDRPSQEVGGTARRVKQDETKVRILDRKHEAWQPATRSELENRAVDGFEQESSQEPLRVRPLHCEGQVADQ